MAEVLPEASPLAQSSWQLQSQGVPAEGHARQSRCERGASPKTPPLTLKPTPTPLSGQRPRASWAELDRRKALAPGNWVDCGGGSKPEPTIGWRRTPGSTLHTEDSPREVSLRPHGKP